MKVTKEQIQPLIHYNSDIEIDNETKDIITDAILDYINRIIEEYLPDCNSWTEVIPGKDYESFAITERNTSVVFIRKGFEIHVTEYSGYVIEK